MVDRRNFVALAAGVAATWTPLGGKPLLAGEKESLSANVERDLTNWNAIKNHRTGTKGDSKTTEWLAKEIEATGQKPEIQRFPIKRRVLGNCEAAVGSNRTTGVPLFDGGLTERTGVQGTLVPFGEKGDIAVTRYGPFWSHPLTQTLEKARRENRYRAIIAIADGKLVRPGLALLNADSYKSVYGPPVLQVSTEQGDWLEEAAQARAIGRVVAHAEMQESSGVNVGMRIEGRVSDLKPLVVMTPKSAWWTCTSERGGGLCAWLAAIREFAAAPPDRPVIFTANTGHELGHVGLDHFIDQDKTLVREAYAWLHLGANLGARYVGPDGIEFLAQASSEELMKLCLTKMTAQGSLKRRTTPVGQRPLGEARNIFDGGGTYVSFLGGGNALFHHPEDILPDSVDMVKTTRLVSGMVAVARDLALRSL